MNSLLSLVNVLLISYFVTYGSALSCFRGVDDIITKLPCNDADRCAEFSYICTEVDSFCNQENVDNSAYKTSFSCASSTDLCATLAANVNGEYIDAKCCETDNCNDPTMRDGVLSCLDGVVDSENLGKPTSKYCFSNTNGTTDEDVKACWRVTSAAAVEFKCDTFASCKASKAAAADGTTIECCTESNVDDTASACKYDDGVVTTTKSAESGACRLLAITTLIGLSTIFAFSLL